MYYLYVLYSLKDGQLYKGTSSDPAKRFIRHNAGGNKSTAHRKPFVLIHLEEFNEKAQALKQERYYKSLEGGTALKQMLVAKGILSPGRRALLIHLKTNPEEKS